MKLLRILLILSFAGVFWGQEIEKIQIISKYEINMNWISPSLPDSSFFTYDSFNYAGFSDLATDCYDDDIDYPEPPPLVDDWCKLTFPHYDNGPGQCWYNNLGLNNFTQDIRYKDDLILQNNYIEWDIEFSASLPGKASLFLLNDNLFLDCNNK